MQLGELDADLFLESAGELWQATQDGWGQQLIDIDYETTSAELLRQMRGNLYVFAAFKNHAQTADLVDLMTDPATGEVRSWPEFRDLARPVVGNYYELWLQAEYETSLASGQMAKKWQDYQANADVLPYLTYKTQQDDRVRPAHAAIDETTLPIDDPFWDKYYPPNGWRCRCTVIQSAGPEKRNELELSEEQAPVAFRNNPGKTGLIFTDAHPYFDTATPLTKRRVLGAMRQILVQEDVYDMVYKSQAGGEVTKHITHNIPATMARHIDISKKLADQGMKVKLLPINFAPGAKNHDAEVGGQLTELLSPLGTYNSMKKALARADNWAVLALPAGVKNGDIVRAVKGATHLNGVVLVFMEANEVYVVRKGQDVAEVLK